MHVSVHIIICPGHRFLKESESGQLDLEDISALQASSVHAFIKDRAGYNSDMVS